MIRPPTIEYPPDGSVRPVRRYIWRPEAASLSGQNNPGRLPGKHLVIAGGTDRTAARIGTTLERAGARISRYTAQDGDITDRVDGIIDLNLEQPFSLATKNVWRDALRDSVNLLKAVYQDWCLETDTSRICYVPVTSLGGRMGYAGNVYQPLGGIWAGLAKTLPREVPNCNVKVLDLSPEDYTSVDEILARELYNWGLLEIGYSGGERFRLAPQAVAVPAAAIDLAQTDIVLISGGGRGIGCALAMALARNFGCGVIITGRSPAPSGKEPWLGFNDDAFKNYRNERLKSAGLRLAAVREELGRMSRQRELDQQLRKIEAEGLPIEYHVCDFTSLEEVRALIDSIGPRLSGIVHNAGVDTPKRLGSKSVDSFLATVDVKVNGFLNIIEALDDRPLKFLSSVGSLTGRMGGMVGQLDYAAGNDGLARLGLWAAANAPYTVKTLCWPTWEKMGMIANYGATLKYMSALDIEEGLCHWQNELISGGSGEVTFMGRFGKALSPIQLNGYPMIADLPETDRLFSHWFYLGEALNFRPFASMRSRNRIPLRQSPCMYDFEWGGRQAIPVSVLLEFACSVGDWIVPDGYPDLALEEIAGVKIHLPGLAAHGDWYEFEKEGNGKWVDKKWVVEVKLANSGFIAEGRLIFGTGRQALKMAPGAPAEPYQAKLGARGNLRWQNRVFRAASWFHTGGEELIGKVRLCRPGDLWSTVFLPRQLLPTGGMESLIRFALAERSGNGDELSIASIRPFDGAGDCTRIYGSPASGEWSLLDAEGRVDATVTGIKRTFHEALGDSESLMGIGQAFPSAPVLTYSNPEKI